MTKTVSSGQDRNRNIRELMFDIYLEDNVGSFIDFLPLVKDKGYKMGTISDQGEYLNSTS